MKKFIVMAAIAAAMFACAENASATTFVSEMPSVSAKPKAETKTVTFKTTIHCANCANKVKENLSFEKGVKALDISVADKTVKITYDVSKTSIEKLTAAIKKLGYEAELIK